MDYLLSLLTDPAAWLALATLLVMEIVLGVDNLIFIAILTNKLPEERQSLARRLGISLALVLRLVLLFVATWVVRLTEPVFTIWGDAFSWRDLVMIAGGLFLLWKATREIHHAVDPDPESNMFRTGHAQLGVTGAVVQILLLDVVFSIDSILTAVGMTPHLPIMVAAVTLSVVAMLFAADPLARFLRANPTVVMLALGFLLMIGMTLIADGFGVHVPRGYIYTAMSFSALVEGLNIMARRAREKRRTRREARG